MALSVVIAVAASYAALDLAGRVTAGKGWSFAAWLTCGSIAMGIGIWSMHFTGMLGFIKRRLFTRLLPDRAKDNGDNAPCAKWMQPLSLVWSAVGAGCPVLGFSDGGAFDFSSISLSTLSSR